MPATRTPVKRSVRLIAKETGENPGIIRIDTDRKTALYAVREIESEIGGRAFLVKEIDAESNTPGYACIAAGDDVICDCIGYSRYGRCKHVSAMFALILRGKI